MSALDYIRDPDEIYRASFNAIQREIAVDQICNTERDVVVRLVHACGMTDIVDDIKISAGAIEKGRAALKKGASVICDAEMVKHGIIAKFLPADNKVMCLLNEDNIPSLAQKIGNTRSAAQVELWAPIIEGSIVVIGNAPTALFHLLELLKNGMPQPALIIGVPVGFVGATESKLALIEANLDVPYITITGRRGGSALASAALNGLAAGLRFAPKNGLLSGVCVS